MTKRLSASKLNLYQVLGVLCELCQNEYGYLDGSFLRICSTCAKNKKLQNPTCVVCGKAARLVVIGTNEWICKPCTKDNYEYSEGCEEPE
jgi:hypothetical protein